MQQETNQHKRWMGKTRRGENLTYEDRVRGGKRSASVQKRDLEGQFAGKKPNAEGNAESTGMDNEEMK